MNTTMTQLYGIMTYEFKMHWRRQIMIAITLVLALLLAAVILIYAAAVDEFQVVMGNSQVITDLITFQTWAPLGVMLAIILPVLLADTVPIDQHLKMREMLNSMPLSPKVYLAGKVAGVWLAMTSLLLVMMLLNCTAWRFVVGEYDLLRYVRLWLLGALPLMALNSGLGVLLAATQPTRRRAVVLVMGMMSLCFTFGFSTGTWWDYVNPIRVPIVEYFMTIKDFQPTHVRTTAQVALVIAIGLAQLGLVWGAVSTWMERN